MKLSRRHWLAIAVWVLLLAALVAVLLLSGLSSVLVGGILGTYCGATIAVVYGAWERAQKGQRPRGPLDERYGRR